jgi:hypothetical protein
MMGLPYGNIINIKPTTKQKLMNKIKVKRLNRLQSEFLLLIGALLSDFQVLLTTSILLSFKFLSSDFLSLLFENSLDKYSSVFELITFTGQVELVVKSAIDLLGLSILSKKSSQDSLPADPKNFGGHSSLTSSSSFTSTSVVTFTNSCEVESSA